MITDERRVRTGRPECRGTSRRPVIEEAKALVPIEGAAERICGKGIRRGREIHFVCCLHDDHNPSLRVDPEKGVWFCDPCLVGGDSVELARLAWGYDKSEVATAAAMLLLEFGHEVPQRPESWHLKQGRQERVRREIEASKIRRVQRRLYRWLYAPIISNFESADERLEEARHAWDDCGRLAHLMVHSLTDRRSA